MKKILLISFMALPCLGLFDHHGFRTEINEDRIEHHIEKTLHDLYWRLDHFPDDARYLKPIINKIEGVDRDFHAYLEQKEKTRKHPIE